MVEVPLEIWIYIASFIPDNDLYNLRGVSRVFFDLAINAQWSKTRISSDITWYKTLQRLSDPFIARRVSNLALYLTHDKSTTQDITQLHKILRNRIRVSHKVVCNIFNLKDKPAESQRKGTTRRCTLKDVIDIVSASNGNFDNVHELSIDGCLFFTQAPTPLPPLSSSFWAPFSANLRILSLGGTLEEFRFILESGYTFECLKELSLRFEQSYEGQGDLSVLVDSVAPFVNAVSNDLEELTVWSRCNLDLSTFFASLSPFPKLRHLKVKLFVVQSLRDPAGLEAIIRNTSSHLERLCIRHCSDSSGPNSSDALLGLWDMSFTRWLLQYAAKTENLPCVRVLDVYPMYTPAGVRVLLDLLQKNPNKLTEVIIRNRLLTREEAMEVIEAAALCSNLTYLRIPVRTLDLTLLDYLASKLPNLPRLYIAIGPDQNPRCSEELKKLQERRYTHWKLNDISIWDHEGHQKMVNTLFVLARSIPSIRSFFGSGHMNLG